MNPHRAKLSDRRYGNLVETLFECAMIENGFVVGRPIGEQDDFDFFVSRGASRPVRVQVKGARMGKSGRRAMMVRTGPCRRPLEQANFDFLVAWLDSPILQWVVISRTEIGGRRGIRFPVPEKFSRSKWAHFAGRWDLLG